MPFRPIQNPTLHNIARYNAITPQATRFESMQANWDLTIPQTLTGGFLDRMSAPDRDVGDMLSAEEANNLFPSIEKPFTRPVSRGFAEHVNLRQQHKQSMEFIAGSAPRGALQFMLDLGASMGATMTDPAEFALSYVATAGIGAALRGASAANRIRQISERTKLLQIAAMNVGGAAVVEPFIAANANYFQEEYTVQQAFTSIAASAILGTAVEYGLGRALNPKRIQEDFMKAQAAAEMGKRPDVATRDVVPTMTVKQNIDPDQLRIGFDGDSNIRSGTDQPFTQGPNPKGYTLNDFPYEFRPISSPSISKSRFFTVTRENRGPIRENSTPLMSILMDGGLQFSDNPRVAASFADTGTIQAKGVGSLREVNINSDKIFDADIPYAQQAPVIKRLMEALGRTTDEITLTEALKDISLRDSTKMQDYIMRIMRESDIEGFHFKDNVDGQDFNSVFLRDNKKVNEMKSYELRQEADPGYTSKAQKYQEDMASDRSNYYYSDDTARAFDTADSKMKAEEAPSPREEVEVTEVQANYDTLKVREDVGIKTKEAMKEVEQLEAELENMDSILKSAFFCGGQG